MIKEIIIMPNTDEHPFSSAVRAGPSPDVIIDTMAKGDPPIIIRGSRQLRWEEQLFVNPHILVEGEGELVGQRLRIAMAEKC